RVGIPENGLDAQLTRIDELHDSRPRGSFTTGGYSGGPDHTADRRDDRNRASRQILLFTFQPSVQLVEPTVQFAEPRPQPRLLDLDFVAPLLGRDPILATIRLTDEEAPPGGVKLKLLPRRSLLDNIELVAGLLQCILGTSPLAIGRGPFARKTLIHAMLELRRLQTRACCADSGHLLCRLFLCLGNAGVLV